MNKVRFKYSLFRRIRFLLLYFLIITGCFTTKAQSGNFKNYSVNDGLSQSQVYTITEGENGYLWLGTRGGGLCKFDGENFETFTKKDGLPSNYINHIYKGNNGELWIATSGGLCVYSKHQFSLVPIDTSSKRLIISTLFIDDQETLWVGTNQGLYQRKDSVFTKIKLQNGTSQFKLEITSIVRGKDHALWIGSNRGLWRLHGEQFSRFTTKDGLSNNYIHSLAFDAKDNLWIGTYGKGISIMSGNKIEQLPFLKQVQNTIVHHLHKDKQNNIWIATLENGLIKWDAKDSSLTSFSEREGLANNHVRCIFEDAWSNLWIGTSGGGVSKYFGQYFEQYNSSSTGLKSDYIYALKSTNDSDLWVATSGLGVDRLINQKIHHYGTDSGFVDEKAKAIFISSDSVVWFGTEGKGLYYFKNGTFSQFESMSKLGSAWIKDVKEDQQGNLWIASSGGGVSQLQLQNKKRKVRRYTRSKGLKSDRVGALHIDKMNRLWIAYQDGGLSCMKNDSVGNLTLLQHYLNPIVIRSMSENKHGLLCLGTAGNGVYRSAIYKDSIEFESLTNEDLPLSSENVYLLAFDSLANLWVGTEKGVDKLTVAPEGEVLDLVRFGIDEGFKGVETARNAITVDPNGKVWIGTINGLFRYNANFKKKNTIAPKLNILDVSLFYSSIYQTLYKNYLEAILTQVEATMALTYQQNHLTFDFKGVLLSQPAKVKYKWKLEGYETDWSPATEKSSITYSNLQPGEYCFKVLSCNEDEVWNSSPQQLAFTIAKPFYKEWWFVVPSLLLFLLTMGVAVRARINSVRKKASTVQELLTMENDLLVLEQKALQLQMNPHFIFNCLNSIQALIVKKDDKTARYFLAKFSKLMRKTLDHSREQWISLDDEIENLETYLSIEKFCNEDHFEYEISVADNLASDFIQVPPMLIQPFVENAIVHGVSHLTGGGKIKVKFYEQDHQLIGVIEDNGVGRKKARELNKNKNKDHKSTALLVTKERLALLNNNNQSSELLIEDILDDQKQTRGARIIIKLSVIE